MQAIILAGGFATRLWPLTEKTPKPLIILAGKPLLTHIAERLPPKIKITLLVNAAFKDDFVKWRNDFLSAHPKREVAIFVEDAQSEGEKLGALFAVATCIQENQITEDLLILGGDNFFDFEMEDFLNSFNKSSPLLAAYDIKNPEEAKKFGVVIGKNGQVKEFVEKPEKPQSTLVSTCCFAIPANNLAELCDYAQTNRDDLGKIFEHFLQKNITVNYFPFEGNWFDVGSFKTLIEAHKKLSNSQSILDPQSYQENTNLIGSVYLAKDTEAIDAEIQDSIILPGAQISGCEIRNSVIGRNSVIKGVDLEWKIIRDDSFLVNR
jgi:glucose-1-phosphate thymidylyltransferase